MVCYSIIQNINAKRLKLDSNTRLILVVSKAYFLKDGDLLKGNMGSKSIEAFYRPVSKPYSDQPLIVTKVQKNLTFFH